MYWLNILYFPLLLLNRIFRKPLFTATSSLSPEFLVKSSQQPEGWCKSRDSFRNQKWWLLWVSRPLALWNQARAGGPQPPGTHPQPGACCMPCQGLLPPRPSCSDLTDGLAQAKWTTPDLCCCQEGSFRMFKCGHSPRTWLWFSSACCRPLELASIW